MTSLTLKIIAMIAMLGDHIGYFLTASSVADIRALGLFLRAVGRIAFPIYCYLIAFGYTKTRNKYKYLLSLIIVGFISEIPYQFTFYGVFPSFHFGNVYFTLALGLLSIIVYDTVVSLNFKFAKIAALIPVLSLAFIANALGTDYSAFGVLLIFAFHIADNIPYKKIAICTLFAARSVLMTVLSCIKHGNFSSMFAQSSWNYMQLFALLALVPILLFNGERGYYPKSEKGKSLFKYAFYIFYPVHIAIIGLIFVI